MFAAKKFPTSMQVLMRVAGAAGARPIPRRLLQRAAIVCPTLEKPQEAEPDDTYSGNYPRKVFSGIQPTGSLHLGNYLGAVKKWTQMQNQRDDVTYCIVDLHSITAPQEPQLLREHIFQMAATMIACGINPDQSTLFVQSAVREHTELAWILGCLTTMARLGHLPQYKEKTRTLKDIPLGLFVYPVLQAADILLYKGTHIPVGEDQVQHIQLAQHLARSFNNQYGITFPLPHAVIDTKEGSRIRSLRDPARKMSKSDNDSRSTINVLDEPDIIVDKFKKAITDFVSDVTFDPVGRPGVSNLVAIHSLVTGRPLEKIVEEARSMNTGSYKLRVAEAVIEHLKPIRNKINAQLLRKHELIYILENGAEKARKIAHDTMAEIKQKTGLGAQHMPQTIDVKKAEAAKVAAAAAANAVTSPLKSMRQEQARARPRRVEMPKVPQQPLRVEKAKNFKLAVKIENRADRKVFGFLKKDLMKDRIGMANIGGDLKKPGFKLDASKQLNQKQSGHLIDTTKPLDSMKPAGMKKQSEETQANKTGQSKSGEAASGLDALKNELKL